MLKFLYLQFFSILINHASSYSMDSMPALSKLNTIELENHKYQIDIDSDMKLDSNYYRLDDDKHVFTDSFNKHDPGFIQIRSKHGQLYECRMPDMQDGFDEDPEHTDDDTVTSFFGSGFHNKQEVEQKSQFNFSVIDEKINSFKRDLTNTCIYRV